MTGTTDKQAEAPVQPAETVLPPPAPEKPVDPAAPRLFWPSPKTIRHMVVEVLIVTIGVLLALGIDQLRQHFTRLAQAEEARQQLRAEIRRNLEAVEQAMPRLAEAYRVLRAEPEKSPSIFREEGYGIPLLFDTAYDLAVQTGALYYLRSEERSAITEVYRGQQTYRDNAEKFSDVLRQLASYPTGAIADESKASARDSQASLAQVIATAVFRNQCRLVIRFTRALGEPRTDPDALGYCRGIDPSMDVEAIIVGRYVQPVTVAPPQPEAAN